MSSDSTNQEIYNDSLIQSKEQTAISTPSGIKRAFKEEDGNSSSSPVSKRANTDIISENMNSVQIQRPSGGFGNAPGIIPLNPSMENIGPGEDESVELMEIPDHTVGLVIGKGGEQIQNIQAQCGCRVQMATTANARNCREVTLTGNKDAILKARNMINDIVNTVKQGSPSSTQPRVIHAEMSIPGRKCGLIIGKNGDTIKNLQQQTGAKMMLIQETHTTSDLPKILKINGAYEQVEAAKKAVLDILNAHEVNNGGSNTTPNQVTRPQTQRFTNPSEGGSYVGEVIVPKTAVGMIIGKNGETIKRLAFDTGAKVQFKPDSNPEGTDRTAVIQGTAEQISIATRLISEIVNKCGGNGQNQETVYMPVPSNKTGLVIGKGGETIKSLIAESSAHIELARDYPCDANEKVFSIKGTPYAISLAQHLIRIKIGEVSVGTPMPSYTPQMQGHVYPGYQNPSYLPNQQCFSGNNQPTQWNNQEAFYQLGGNFTGTAPYGSGMGYNAQQGTQMQNGQTSTTPVAGVGSVSQNQGNQPDYSADWARYYRSVGMIEHAEAIEKLLKKNTNGAGTGPVNGNPATYQSNFDGARGMNGQHGTGTQSSGPYKYPQ
uniref:K Homology domain-containing protein n=1 Tax=Strongyloides stercoralis TaxID=6248 RepID=A0A0K0EML0_STRER